jgi:lipid-A-disaccharide synthase
MNPQKLMIIAGEASGDLHGSNLVKAIRCLAAGISFFGIGGEMMRNQGVDIFFDVRGLSVMGATEVLAKLPAVFRALREVKRLLRTHRPDLLILIDFPEFNLKAAGYAKGLGIPVLYYISPKIWAWRSGRVKKIKALVDHMAVILPFERQFYQDRGIDVTYVGNPLMDIGLLDTSVHESAAGKKKKTIGLLPGSREKEVAGILPVMIKAANLLSIQDKELTFLVSKAPGINRSLIETIVAPYPAPINVEITTGEIKDVFRQCDWVMAASGTVTLEAAIAGIPMIVLYKMSPVSYWLARKLVKLTHASLVNLIAGREVVPELLQQEATPENIVKTASCRINDPEARHRMEKELDEVRKMLGGPGASDRVARIALEMMQ